MDKRDDGWLMIIEQNEMTILMGKMMAIHGNWESPIFRHVQTVMAIY